MNFKGHSPPKKLDKASQISVTVITKKCKYYVSAEVHWHADFWLIYYDGEHSYSYFSDRSTNGISKIKLFGDWFNVIKHNSVNINYVSIIKYNHLERPDDENDPCDRIIIDDKMLCIYNKKEPKVSKYHLVTEINPLENILDDVVSIDSYCVIYNIPI
uniref:P19 n=1 Tax=Olivavirus actinidiae TaxID=2024724 RepID=A0A7L9CC37_9CLOS|nr:P19 [Actinidia virus 1]